MVRRFVYDPKEVAMDGFFSSVSSQQANISAELSKLPPLNLNLRKTPSFLNLLKTKLSNNEGSSARQAQEKMKASNFRASFLQIGSWQEVSRHESDLVAKCYYSKRKLVWEVLRNGLKSKIEIQWSDISAIRATLGEDRPGILEIELDQSPTFYRESNPQPRKHTIWHMTTDFTDGQVSLHRRHYVRFPPGVLDKQYEKLLQCDHRLLELSMKGFPSHDSPFFDWAPFDYRLSYSYNPPSTHEPDSQIHFGVTNPRESQPVDPVHQLFQTHQTAFHPSLNFEDSSASPVSGTQQFQDNTITEFSPSSDDQNFDFGDSMTMAWCHGTENFLNDHAFYGTTGLSNIYQQTIYENRVHDSYDDTRRYIEAESSMNVNCTRPVQDTTSSYANSDYPMGTSNDPQTPLQYSNSLLPSQYPDDSMDQFGNIDYMYPPFNLGF